jgi:hypothetical protein
VTYYDLEHKSEGKAQTITTYNLTIAYREGAKPTQFVLTESRNNEGPPISDTLILKTARAMARRFELEPQQPTVYAERGDGSFSLCNFKEYTRGSVEQPERFMDFQAGAAKIPVTKEYVEREINEKLPERSAAQQRNAATPSLDDAYFPARGKIFPERER